MANNYTLFSTDLNLSVDPKIFKKQKKWIEKELEEREDEDYWPDFGWEILTENKFPPYLWIHSEDNANLENVAEFVQRFLKKWDPKGSFSLQWADTCDKPRIDEFGGGALYVTATEKVWAFTSTVLDRIQKGWRP